MRASDHLYDYEMWRTDETMEISKEEAIHEFKKLMYLEHIIEMFEKKELNPDVDWYDGISKAFARKYKIEYRRKSKNDRT